ncbi:hypothetical protein AAMO2058_001563700 [Amorphochlora amoebiformis]
MCYITLNAPPADLGTLPMSSRKGVRKAMLSAPTFANLRTNMLTSLMDTLRERGLESIAEALASATPELRIRLLTQGTGTAGLADDIINEAVDSFVNRAMELGRKRKPKGPAPSSRASSRVGTPKANAKMSSASFADIPTLTLSTGRDSASISKQKMSQSRKSGYKLQSSHASDQLIDAKESSRWTAANTPKTQINPRPSPLEGFRCCHTNRWDDTAEHKRRERGWAQTEVRKEGNPQPDEKRVSEKKKKKRVSRVVDLDDTSMPTSENKSSTQVADERRKSRAQRLKVGLREEEKAAVNRRNSTIDIKSLGSETTLNQRQQCKNPGNLGNPKET